MTEKQIERHIAEAASSLAVEGLVMTDAEKDNIRAAFRGERTFEDLIAQYVAEARVLGLKYA
ncbi:MAG: hypothetical protein IJO87_09780 [Eggerthellaceae bacterium]|nr:hypothetical protein [Eggerthellaceae bacterium]